jgi:hypothetical protein
MKKLFDRLVLLVSGLSLALIGLALLDFLLHPLAQDYIFQSTLYRAVVILVLTPLNLLAGFLIPARPREYCRSLADRFLRDSCLRFYPRGPRPAAVCSLLLL